ncbi:S41 family peptidase [Winogradskyella luteola]|uniref:S41 family peptidase n=1 Tax=Winogradskyella luteola TaxID=2828330 RepID=UPI00210BB799|nr:S41 family peptidase [Winogradskyella luteola]
MKNFKTLLLTSLILLSVTSCFDDIDDNTSFSNSEVKDFVWKGMNAVYLYKAEIPDLANDRFNSNEEYNDYLNSFATPEALFESLKYLPESVDRFSRIVDNYFDLQNQQQGITLSNGIEFNFERIAPGSDELYCAITLVLNNSVASDLGLQRGQIFRAVDGIDINVNNAVALLSQNSYTLNFADYDDNDTPQIDDDTINLNGNSVTLSQEEYTENPVHIAQTITLEDNTKVGYLMYNQFNSSFNNALNNAFGDFQAEGIDELVLDLRYNGGGSVQTAAYLGSMVTGQFTGQVYSKLFYNENLQDNNEDFLFTNSIAGGGSINSLNLSKVYVLTTNLRTASASELVINSLSPYIDVVVIGENTVGKTQASITIYDSPNLAFEDVNPNHTYAMQPLVANSTNVNDELVPSSGLTPNIGLSETLNNLGTLGDVNEPLLAAAIAYIMGMGRVSYNTTSIDIDRSVKIQLNTNPFEQDMFLD